MTAVRTPLARAEHKALLRAAAACKRIADRAASDARVAEAKGEHGQAGGYRDQARAARECEQAVRALMPRNPVGRPKGE
jgi:hypothetical protein